MGAYGDELGDATPIKTPRNMDKNHTPPAFTGRDVSVQHQLVVQPYGA